MLAIPLGFFHVLGTLAAGGLGASLLAHQRTPLARGYLLLNGATLLLFALLAVWLRWALPLHRLVPYDPRTPWVQLEAAAWTIFAGALALHLLMLRAERLAAAMRVGWAAVALGLVALSTSAGAYVPPDSTFALVLLAFLASAFVLGAVWSGWMLGHWYLVTPRLSPRPLLLINAILAGGLGIQSCLILGQLLTGAVPLSNPEAVLLAPGLTWWLGLRVGVGVAFPLILSWMIWRTARTRSMMAATGLLYIAVGAVVSGDIIARMLLFAGQAP